jgi:hypothetical protein
MLATTGCSHSSEIRAWHDFGAFAQAQGPHRESRITWSSADLRDDLTWRVFLQEMARVVECVCLGAGEQFFMLHVMFGVIVGASYGALS